MQKRTIRIEDSIEGCLSFDLIDILKAIEKHCRNFRWDIVVIEPVSMKAEKITDEINYHTDFAQKDISFDALYAIAEIFIQIQNCTIIGNENGHSVKIICLDTSFWEVESNYYSVIETLQNSFKETQLV